MNILVIGKFAPDLFAFHIADTLTDMGHNVHQFEIGYKGLRLTNRFGNILNKIGRTIYSNTDSIPAIRAIRIRALWRMVEKILPEIIIVCHDFLWPEEVVKLKQSTSAKIALWFPDALINMSKGYFMNAPYDGLFFKDPYIVKTLSEVLLSPVYYLPECFNPKYHYLAPGAQIEEKYHCDITTAGNSHSWRVAFYKHLVKYNVKLWGPRAPLWMSNSAVSKISQNQSVINESKACAFLGAKIVLNNLHFSEICGLNARAFEVAGIGAFQMVNWRPGLGQLFEDGKEIISFKNMDDMHTQIDYWLNHPEERKAIANAGKKRAYAEHTYNARLTLLLMTLEQKAQGFTMPSLT